MDDKPVNWDNYIVNCQNSKLHIFIVKQDSIKKYGLDVVIKNNIYTKEYNLDIIDLNEINWKILYK